MSVDIQSPVQCCGNSTIPEASSYRNYVVGMGRKVDLDELVDTVDVAELVGLTNATSVATYRSRYEDFPQPVWVSRGGRCQLWLRPEVEAWATARGQLR